MLINSRDAEKRLSSPDNLLNRLRRESPRSVQAKNAMSLFLAPQQNTNNPFNNLNLISAVPIVEPPSIYNPSDDSQEDKPDEAAGQVLNELDIKIKQESIQSAALNVLSQSIQKLGEKITAGEVGRAKDLADIARKMGGIITDIKKTEDTKDKDGKTVHLHFYTPERKKLSDFEVIDVG